MVLSLVCALGLLTVPVALTRSVDPSSPSDIRDLIALRDADPAARSGVRTPLATDPATPEPTPTSPASPTAPDATPSTVPDPVPVPDPAPEPPPEPTMVDEIVTRTNAERAAAGLAPLAVSACGTEQAVARTALLVAENRFEHDPLEPILAACPVRAVGENLALGYPTATAVVAGWMGSDGHRANILNPRYTEIGVGCTTGRRGALCAQVFLG